MLTRPRLMLLGALASAAAVALVAASDATSAGPAGKTRIVMFDPWNQAGLRPGFRIAKTVRGSCFAGSLASSHRSDAWRCTSGNRIYDPCFESPLETVGCVSSPWSRRVLVIRPTKPLPEGKANRGVPPAGPPWAIQLYSGKRCELLTGATGEVDRQRIN